MTVGEKIKYYRTQLGITQGKLAELSGIHPVSIRKYETNKMQPLPPQIEKIADALGVSYNALSGLEHAGMRLETIGDLMGVLIVLCNSNIINISGKRDANNQLKEETIEILINPILSGYANARIRKGNGNETVTFEDISFNIYSPLILPDLLKWEKMNYMYHTALASLSSKPTKKESEAMNDIIEMKEKVELQLQKSQVILDDSCDIKVKVPPNIL